MRPKGPGVGTAKQKSIAIEFIAQKSAQGQDQDKGESQRMAL